MLETVKFSGVLRRKLGNLLIVFVLCGILVVRKILVLSQISFNFYIRFLLFVFERGIELYITKRILENAGGKIEVKSEEGKGSVFRAYFRK